MAITLNGTTGIQNVLGSAAAPAESNTTSSNTGMYFPTSTTLGFSTAGTNAVTIDASQNVGIGVTSTGGYKVAVGGSGLKNQFITTDANNAYLYTDGGAYFGSTAAFNTVFITNNTERARIDSSGRVLVNSTSDVGGNNPAFSVNAAAAATFGNIMEARWTGTSSIYHLLVRNGNGLIGGVQSSGSTTAFLTSSDYRLKNNIAPMTGALAKVAALKPVTYKWKADNTDGEGFIAHELAAVCPIAVHGEKDALNEDGSIKSQSVDTSFLVATLTAAIQEQQALITQLTDRIAALEVK